MQIVSNTTIYLLLFKGTLYSSHVLVCYFIPFPNVYKRGYLYFRPKNEKYNLVFTKIFGWSCKAIIIFPCNILDMRRNSLIFNHQYRALVRLKSNFRCIRYKNLQCLSTIDHRPKTLLGLNKLLLTKLCFQFIC